MNIKSLWLLHSCSRYYGMRRTSDVSVSNTEGRICVLLLIHGETRQEDIGAALLVNKTTVAKALSRLEKKHRIKRRLNPDNRREKLIELTESGKEAFSEIYAIQNEWSERVSEYLTAEENQEFDRLCAKLIRGAEKMLADDK